MYNVLRRENLIYKVQEKKRRRANKKYYGATIPGEKMQVDVKYVPSECVPKWLAEEGQKFYQWTIIDEATRYRFNHLAMLGLLTTYSSCAFILPYFNAYSQIFLRLTVVYVILILTTTFLYVICFLVNTIIPHFRVVFFFYCNISILAEHNIF